MNNPEQQSMAKRLASRHRIRWMAAVAALVGLGACLTTVVSCAGDPGGEVRAKETNWQPDAGPGVDAGADADETGQPCIDGSKRECKITIGEVNGVLTCVEGTRTCVDGVWGPCVGTFTARDSSPENLLASQPAPQMSLKAADGTAYSITSSGPCTNNPCDPYCSVYAENPTDGYEVTPTIESVYYTGSLADAIKLTPPGFMDKGLKTPCTKTLDCQFDMHCLPTGTNETNCAPGVAKCCMPWKPTEYDKTCSLPDPTTGFACTQYKNGKPIPVIPVCNRGSTVIPAGVRIYIFPGNSPQFPLCIPDKDPQFCDTTEPVQPGKCINVAGCPGLTGNGTKSIMVNGPKNPGAQLPSNPKWIAECACENNWGVWSGNNTPCYENYNYSTQPVIKSEIYQAVCPAGTHPQWGYLTWNATTPLDSSVVFDARVSSIKEVLPLVDFVRLGTAKALPAPDTQLCLATGPAPCPINLFNAFDGNPGPHAEFLELRFSLNPSTDKSAGPKLNSWQITYSCPPTE